VDSGPVCADLGGFPSNRQIAFPLPREYVNSYEDTWGAPRPQGGHEGTDLMVPTGTAEYAITDGTIVAVDGANEHGWNTLGGYTVMLRATYSVGPIKHGDLFYYAHLNRESALEIGTKVRVGQTIGYAGNTGQGPEVTRGLFPPHLHFGWYDATGTRSTATSGAMNPYPLLEWIKANGGAITGGSDARYCESPRTGGPVPSAGASRWPAPRTPGVSPDIGSNAPSAAPTGQQQPSLTESPRPTPGGAAQQIHPQTSGFPSSQLQIPPAPRAGPTAGPTAGGSAPQEEPDRAPAGGSSQDHSDLQAPNADANETADDPSGEQNADEHADQGSGEDAPQAAGEEPEDEGSEDGSQADDQDSPGEDQYTPETGTSEADDDPEATTAEEPPAAR
jgi:collagen type III alpha